MTTLCSRKRRSGVLPIVLLTLPLATGCGGQAKGTVSGTVTYQGKQLPSGMVTFVPEKGAPLYSPIQSDGSYRMENVPAGPVKIGVQPKTAQATQDAPSAMPRNPADYGKVKTAQSKSDAPIPPKYADPNQSGLTYTVTQGSQQHDIVLK
jgi:hypothetical protein